MSAAVHDHGEGNYALVIVDAGTGEVAEQAAQVLLQRRFPSAQARLEGCVEALTETHLHNRVGLLRLRDLVWNAFDGDPDRLLDHVARCCRERGLHLYVSPAAPDPATTHDGTPGPVTDHASTDVLYTVQTEYSADNVVVEHFTSSEARHDSLRERADQFFAGPGLVPEQALVDDHRLAGLISVFIAPARVTLSEAGWDAERGTFHSTAIPTTNETDNTEQHSSSATGEW